MSIGKGFFVASSVYFYGYDEQPYTCLYENEDIVLFSFPYQGYKRHALMQLKDLRAEEWSMEAKPLHKKTLTSLFVGVIKQTEDGGDYQHRTENGNHLSETITTYGHLTGQGLMGDYE